MVRTFLNNLRFFIIIDDRGECDASLKAQQEYVVNGVTYLVESVFMSPEKNKPTLRSQIKRLIENEYSYLTNENSPGTMATKCVCSAAEKED